jgi:hypothetical protein
LQQWVGGHNRVDEALSNQLKVAVVRAFLNVATKPAKPRVEHLGPIATLPEKTLCFGVKISGAVQIAQFGQAIGFL